MTARVNLHFSILPTSLPANIKTFITFFFLRGFNRMATDTDSLAAGLDGNVLRLGIGRKR
jgi:hypothetical protein